MPASLQETMQHTRRTLNSRTSIPQMWSKLALLSAFQLVQLYLCHEGKANKSCDLRLKIKGPSRACSSVLTASSIPRCTIQTLKCTSLEQSAWAMCICVLEGLIHFPRPEAPPLHWVCSQYASRVSLAEGGGMEKSIR